MDEEPVEVKPDTRRRIAIVGEIPFSGAAVARALVEQNYMVRVLCPNSAALEPIQKIKSAHPDDIEIVNGDLGSTAAVNQTFANCYGACFTSPITLNGRTYRPKSHLNDVREFIQAAEQHALRKVVYHSALSAHPDSQARTLRDSAQAEELVAGCRCEDYRVRTGPLMGTNDGFLSELGRIARVGGPLMTIWGYGATPLQPVFVDDFAACLTRIFEELSPGESHGHADPGGRRELMPGVYLVAGPTRTTYLDLLDATLVAAGRNKLKFHLPLFTLKACSMVNKDSEFNERLRLHLESYCAEKNDASTTLEPERRLSTPDDVIQGLGLRSPV